MARGGFLRATSFSQVESARDRHWSTGLKPHTDPVREWADAISIGITEMDITSPVGRRFTARWQRVGLGPVDLNFLSAGPQRVVRSTAIVARTVSPDYDLLYLRGGTVDVLHCGRKLHVPQGAFVLLNNQQPYELSFKSEADCLTAHLTDHWLRKWVSYPEALVARTIVSAATWGAPLAATLVAIADRGLDGVTLQRCVIADQCGALLALMAGVPDTVSTRHNDELCIRLKRELEARFHEPELDPTTLAHSMSISKRHLHSVFAGVGTTFGATLLEIRLTHAAVMLGNPGYTGYSIGDVAFQCGFADASHFARRFKARFGLAPAEYRAMTRQNGPAPCGICPGVANLQLPA
jgi:AraC-like DNA-binding protein